ncbi:MAG: archaetidylserine decarboxylase [Chromatiales bacterium]|nr:archaetidylserine decarboxylase [Chromatiales bacterium]
MTQKKISAFGEWLFVSMQYLLPQHALSRIIHQLMRIEISGVKNLLIRWFVGQFKVDLSEARRTQAEDYSSFNDFFTRSLDDDARPVAFGTHNLVSPVDGRISELGDIHGDRILQAKGATYTVSELLGGDQELAREFLGGEFATLYLAPSNYHRIHMPLTGNLQTMTYIPGKLFSVNEATVRGVPGLFARNERVVCNFETEHGPMVMVLVGAMFVGSIETVWAGEITPGGPDILTRTSYRGEKPVRLVQGEEMGRFNMGSTVILLMPNGKCEWLEDLQAGSPIQMGQLLATTGKASTSH